MTPQTQKSRILRALKSGRHLSNMDLLAITHSRKSDSRISDLRASGESIGDYWCKKNGKRFKKYYWADV